MLAAALTPLAGANNWPKKGYDTANTGCSPEWIPNFTPWNQTVGPQHSYCTPAIADGVLYIGSDYVYALNASTGAQIWNHTTYTEVASVAVSQGIVYATSWQYVYALNASTGAELWIYETGSKNYTPNIVDGVLYFGSLDVNLYALNSSTGTMLWKFTTGDGVWDVCPAVANGLVYFGSNDHNIYCLNASTGSKVWNYLTGDSVMSVTPAVSNGVVYVGSWDLTFYALDALTGELKWSIYTNGPIHTAAVVEDVVYFSSGFFVNAFNAADGALVWYYPVTSLVHSAPAVCDGAVYFTDVNRTLFAFDLKSGDLKLGEKLWNITLSDNTCGPVISGGSLFLGVQDGYVCSFRTLINVNVRSDNEAAFASQYQFLNYGDNTTLSFTANAGYKITNVYIDDQNMGPITEYRYTNIQRSSNITVATQALPTPTNSPSGGSDSVVPEFSAVMLVPLFVALIVAAITVKLAKNRTKTKPL